MREPHGLLTRWGHDSCSRTRKRSVSSSRGKTGCGAPSRGHPGAHKWTASSPLTRAKQSSYRQGSPRIGKLRSPALQSYSMRYLPSPDGAFKFHHQARYCSNINRSTSVEIEGPHMQMKAAGSRGHIYSRLHELYF